MGKIIRCAAALSLAALWACGNGNGNEDADTGQDPASDPAHDEISDPAADDVIHDPAQDMPADDAAGEETVNDPPPDTAETTDSADAPGCEVDCMEGLTCCDGRCVNLDHDPDHCSACGSPCPEATPYCDYGACDTRPCETECTNPTECCGMQCCNPGQICCIVEGGPVGPPSCHDDFCPGGCPLCP